MSSKKIKIDNTDFEWEKEISIKEQELSDIEWSDTLANISSVLNKKSPNVPVSAMFLNLQ